LNEGQGEGGTGKGLREALRLVVILDDVAAGGRDMAELAAAAVRGGATMLQVRGKQTAPGPLADITRRVMAAAGSIPVVVNDRLDVALAAGAAGCHLGQDDFPISEARGMVPAAFLLGGSAGTADEARHATRAGAHYLGVGPVRITGNKTDAGAAIGPGGFASVRAATQLPCVAIGGIQPSDVGALLDAGAAGIAVIGAALNSLDVESAVRLLAKELKS
jgi:thiamine-phosphate pyrophosphorylase